MSIGIAMTDEEAVRILAEALHSYHPADAVNEPDPNVLYGVPEDQQLDTDEPHVGDSSGVPEPIPDEVFDTENQPIVLIGEE